MELRTLLELLLLIAMMMFIIQQKLLWMSVVRNLKTRSRLNVRRPCPFTFVIKTEFIKVC